MDYSVVLGDIHKKSTLVNVEKSIPVQFDLGNLTAFDILPLNEHKLKTSKEVYLNDISRDNAQILINQLFNLPVRRVETAVLAKLPIATTSIPREKHIPEPKPKTRWERFALSKGIQKKKRSRNVWDEVTASWKPRHGYDRANDSLKDWLVELPDNDRNTTMSTDAFDTKLKARKARITKNLKNHANNEERRKKEKNFESDLISKRDKAKRRKFK